MKWVERDARTEESKDKIFGWDCEGEVERLCK